MRASLCAQRRAEAAPWWPARLTSQRSRVRTHVGAGGAPRLADTCKARRAEPGTGEALYRCVLRTPQFCSMKSTDLGATPA